jgi:hypothetical protein
VYAARRVATNARKRLRRGRASAERATENAARWLGYEFKRRSFYLPFPEVESLPKSLWDGPREMLGVGLRLDEATRLLAELKPFAREFPDSGIPIRNGSYEEGDAETLYGLLRHIKPRQVVEFGSGTSSHVIAAARAANERDTRPFSFENYDPYVGSHPLGPAPGVNTQPIAAERLQPEVVEALADGDVLFVDTTHTVRTGGDVAHIVLRLLPHVAPGVWVHFHDIFLPFEYPREWVIDLRRAWAEQYLLQAFLAFNPVFQVELPVHALFKLRPEAAQDAIPSLATVAGSGPGAFWIRRVQI